MRSRGKAGAGQVAWLWLRNQPGSALSAWHRDRVRDGKGRIERIAITALAPKLLVALRRFVTQGLVPPLVFHALRERNLDQLRPRVRRPSQSRRADGEGQQPLSDPRVSLELSR